MPRPDARPARRPSIAQRFACLLALAMGGALPAAPALAQTGPSFASDASVAEQIYQPGTAISTLNLPAATGGSGTLSYTLTPTASIPSGLSFSASARTLTGTPAAGAVVASLTYTVTDAGGNTDTLPVTIVVRPEPTITLAAASVTNEPVNTYTAVLSAEPASDVTLNIRLAFNFVEPVPAGFQADQSSLVFTPSNWNTQQTVTLTYTQGISAGTIFVHHDVMFEGRTTHTATTFYSVIVVPRIVVSPASLTINEGSSANYTVVWEFLQPRSTATTITVTPATSDATVATVSGPLTFIHGGPNSNWDTPQMVTVNAVTVGDADTMGGTATITHRETGAATTVTLASVAVEVVDSDSLRQLSVSVDDSTPEEGGEAVFTVTLMGQAPVAMQPVTVDWAVSGAQSADYSVSGADTDGTLSFTGLGSQNLTLAITDDALSEGEETLTFTLSGATRADILTASATATIGESDRPITVSFAAVSGTERTEGTGHRFSLNYPENVVTTAPVLVDWQIAFPAASQMVDPADAADFASTTGTASILAGDKTNEFRITALADNLNEAVESFTVTVSNPRGGGAIAAPSLSSSTTVNATIAASNPVAVSIAGPTPPTAAEGGSAVFSISINNASEASVSVPWSVNELSDAGIIGSTSGTVTFTARTATLSQNITIPLSESDELGPLSPTETLTMTLGTVSGGRGTLSGSGAMASVTVSFTGAARRFTITGPATIAETDSPAESRAYTITLNGQAFSATTAVTWTVTHGDTSDADFVAASDRSGTVNFGPDDGDGATRSFSITVAGDNESESDETFSVQASVADDTADDGTEFGTAASTTITDDDSRSRVLTVTGPSSIAENDDATNGAESGDYTVTLTGSAFSTDTVATWAVTHGDTSDADFLAASDRSGMLNFDGADGDGATKTFSITIAGDQLNEGAESFSVQISVADAAADGGTGYGDPAFTTITDDETDEIVVYVESSGTISEGGSTPLTVRFRVDLNGQTPAGDVVVSYTLAPGSSAFTVDDITATSLTGMQTLDVDHATTPVLSSNLNISPADDSLNEGAESFSVTATAAIGADSLRVVNNSGAFTIAASDFITAQLSSTTTLSEGASPAATVTLSLDNTPTTQVTVDYTIGADTDDATIDASAADYSGASGSVTFAANTAPAAMTLLSIVDDNLNESSEVFSVTIRDDQVRGALEGSGQNQMSRGASQSYTISASDAITVRIAADAATVNEGAAAQFTVTLDGASAGSAAAITVPYTVSGTTDTPTDANSGSIEIAAGQSSGAITLRIPFSQTLDDDSPAETLRVTLGAVSVGAGGGQVSAAASPNNAASVAVNYLSAAHTISFTNPATSIVEGGSATYTVTRSGPDVAGAAGIVLSWAYAAGSTNPAGAADFAGGAVPAGGTLTFTGAQTTQTFTISTAEDTLSEPGETFTLSLSATPAVLASEGGVALPAAIGITIGESDRPVTLQIAAPGSDFTEGAASNFTVSFPENVITTDPITVYWRNLPTGVTTDTARNPDFDAAGLTGNTVIAAGQSSAVIAITPSADNQNEGPETFTVRITSIDPNSGQRGGAIAAPVIGATNQAQATIAASDPLTVRLARRSGQTGAVAEGGDAEFTVSLVLTADGSTAATSAGDICAMFSTEVSQTATPAAGANPNTANNPDIEVRGCDGNLAAISATSQASGGVVISAGQSSTTLRIPVRFDDEDEGSAPETLRVALTGATHTALSGAAALTADTTAATAMLQNVNALRSLAVSAATLTGDEDSASQPGGAAAFVDYTVGIVGADLEEAVTANWTLAAADGANLPAASALARNHGGEHEADFGRAAIAEAGGGTVNADGASGTLRFPVGAPTSRTIRVPIVQDALNEGAERLTLRVEDPCPATGVCTLGGGSSGGAPALQLSTGERAAVIPPSDPAMLRITRVGSGTVVSGEGITYEVSLGTTFLNGQSVPVRASAPLAVMVPLRVGGADSGQSFTVEVPAGQSAAQAEVPAAVLSQALSGQSGTPMLSLGMAMVSGAPGPSGGTAMQMAMVVAPDPADPADSANLPAPVQTATWELTRTLPGGLEAPEGGSYEVTFALSGSDTPAGGLSFDWSVTGRTLSDGGEAAVAADFARAAGYDCGAAAVGATCTSLPSGTVTFTAGNSSQTVAIAVRDDSADNPAEGRGPGGMIRAEGFALTFTALRGTDAGRVEYAADSQLPGTPLQVTIPALRADLSVANATAAEGASAVFRLTLSGFVGGDATIQPVVVSYRVGVDAAGAALAGDTATLGADYSAPETSITIPAGESENQSSTAIEIPLVLDGVLEPRETFTLTITGATGGGGTIRLVRDPSADPIVVADEISATGTITDDADQAARRRQRVGALVTVLDRQTALLATDAITARLSRPHAGGAQSAPGSLSIANRNLINARNSAGDDDANIGLALYGAAADESFGGLGAGLAGGANLGTRTALPTLAQLMNGSSFRFGAASDVLAGLKDFANGIEVWGSGGYVDLLSESRSSGLTYDGESIAAFLGADAIVPQLPNLLAGLAVGWSAGDLDFTDRAGGFTMRGKLENNSLSVHPYFGWQFSPHANAWLVLGFGAGSVDIEENEGSGAAAVSRKLDGGDSSMLMFSTGITGTQQIGETGDLKLRFAVTRVQSRVDSGRFDDGALLPETRGRSLRFGGEAEAGRRITLENGLSLRPFGTLRVRLDNASAESGVENAALDWGAGITAAWSDLGLDGSFAFRRQLNDTGDEEQGVSLDLSFAPGALGQGIAISLQSVLQQRRPGLAHADGGLGNALLGTNNALGNNSFGAAGASGNSFGAAGVSGNAFGANSLGNASNALGSASASGAGMQHTLSGEIAYGMALRYFGHARSDASRSALLTPYGRFHLGNANTRWAAGLRLAQPRGLQLGLEAGLDLNSGSVASAADATPRSYDLLLTGRLNF